MNVNNVKVIASDSHNIDELRQKLIKQQDKENNQKTPEKIDQMRDKIQEYISNNAHVRVAIKKENLSLFDKNQNSCEPSKTVQKIQEMLASSKVSSN